jgi:hypothetical protein
MLARRVSHRDREKRETRAPARELGLRRADAAAHVRCWACGHGPR